MNRQRGQLMAEALIAITIITVGIVGILSLLGQSLSVTKVVGNEYIGANLAAEGIELMKNVIDNHVFAHTPWGAGINPGAYEMDYSDVTPKLSSNPSSQFLKFDPTTGLYSYKSGNNSIFRRTIIVDIDPDRNGTLDQIKVNSVVEWNSKGSPFKVDVEDRFFDWTP